MRRLVCAALFAIASVNLGWSSAAIAQNYPDRPVKIVVPFAPGGSTDVAARIVAQAVSESLKQPFVFENKPGAGGAIGTETVARAAADGYTLGATGTGSLTILPFVDSNLPYSPDKDLKVIAILSKLDIAIVVKPDSKIASMKGLIEQAKAKPSGLTYSTAGAGTPAHLDMENLWSVTGVKILHVPFNGDIPAVTGVLGGNVDFGFNAVSSVLELVKAGKLKVLAVGGSKRFAGLPDVPTISEALGLKDYTAEAFNALIAPAGTPAEIVKLLNGQVIDALKKPEVGGKLLAMGLSGFDGDAQAASDFVRRDAEKRKHVIKLIGFKRN